MINLAEKYAKMFRYNSDNKIKDMCLSRLLIFSLQVLLFPTKANLQKCVAKGNVTHYFNQSDSKAKAKCVTPPTTVLKRSPKKNDLSLTDKSTTQAPINPNCAGSGGVVKVNGKTFHIDAAELCRRYGLSKKGSIKRGVRTKPKHVKLHYVNMAFRKQFAAYINKEAKKQKLDPAFVHAIVSAESAYNPNATSRSGAMGLMQLMPMTAKRFKVKNAYDPYQNVAAGAKYLRILLNEFGTLELAAAGYNAGEGSVRKYNRSIPPFKETMAYVPKVMAFYRQYKKQGHLITP